MYKYRCTSRVNILFTYKGSIREVRHNEIIESDIAINHPYLSLQNPPKEEKPKVEKIKKEHKKKKINKVDEV